ncbi:MAG TPA: DUF6587 family protein [Steroidobacteraceae bacterium]|nr:DUF6587 family protein [Steroidobacteraceae bacterium]
MAQLLIVAIIGTWAALFAAWKLMPARSRLRLLLALDGWAAARPKLSAWRTRSLKPRIARAAGGGCDGCAAHDTAHRPR